MTTILFIPVATGVKFVKKANMWLFYKCYNRERTPDVHEWFMTELEAQKRFEQDQNGE